ncbi:MAG TPA: pyridoxal phosphate-dependent aminotransferase [Vicinamibacterales bacterium]|nr:pyridoxal phosphate-dependent aminotransferase [Vicinamibacterales bacterium]
MKIPQRVRDIECPQFDVLNDIAAAWRHRGADVITLGQGLPGFDPPRVAVDALRAAVDDGSSHIYSADAGIPELRRALTESLAPLGATLDPDAEVIVTAGGNQALQLALTTLIDPGDEVLLVSPFFLNHEMAIRSVGGVPVEAAVPASRNFVPVYDDLLPHLSPKTRAVILVTPSNPTGAITPPRELERIVSHCAARDVMVFVDETYLRFAYDGEPFTALSLPRWRDNVVIIGSFSKQFAITGWRCGYLAASAEVIAQALKIQDVMVICAPVPVQRAVAAILEAEPDYASRWLPELRERRDRLVAGLGAIAGVTPVRPAGAFFVMTRLEGMTDSRRVAMEMIERQQVVTIPGAFFGRAAEGYLRLSFGAASQERLSEATARIAMFLRAAAPR